MSNSQESIKCPVCLTPFDADNHTPKIFPTCGHTVCEECLVQVLKMSTPKCPLDKLKFGYEFRSVEAFPTNFLGKDLLQKHDKWTRCSAHHEKNKLICLTDQTLICTDCVIVGDHQDHDVKLLSDYENIANQKESLLSDLLKKIAANKDEVDISIQEKSQAIKEIIQERFRHLHEVINKHEAQMLFELERVLQEEKMKFENNLLEEKVPEIENKIEGFSKIMSNPNIMKILEEDFTELGKTVTERLTLNSQKIKEFTNLLAIFEDSLPKEDFLKDLNVIDILDKNLAKFEEQREFNFQEGTKQIKDVIITSDHLTIKIKDQILEIYSGGFRSMKSLTFERSKLEKMQKIEYHLSLKEGNEEDVDTVVPALLKLTRFLPNVKTVNFTFQSQSGSIIHSNERFHNLLLATLSQPENIEKLYFKFSDHAIADPGFLSLTKNILPKIKDLDAFSIIMTRTPISSRVFKAFAQVNWKAWPNLETLRLDLRRASFEENDVIKLFESVPNVKDLLFGFGNTQLTDQALETFSTKILPSLDKLERLEVGLWGTQLTNIGVEKFLMNIPNIKHLLLGIERLEITDEVVKTFLDRKLPLLTQLKGFQFAACRDHHSQEIIEQIREWEKKILKENDDPRYEPAGMYTTWKDCEGPVDKKTTYGQSTNAQVRKEPKRNEQERNPFRDIFF